MGKFLFMAAGAMLFAPFFVFAQTDHLVISQVQITGGSGKTTNDFVEIYNPTDQDIDLNGMRLVKRTKTGDADSLLKSWTETATVKAHGYYLWANSDYTDIPAQPDITTSGSLANDNGVALRLGPNDTGTIIDSLAWGEAANAFVEGTVFAVNPGVNEVLERKPGGVEGNGEDTDNNSVDFALNALLAPRNSETPVAPALTVPETEEPLPAPAPETETPAPSSSSPSGGGGGSQPTYSSAVTISEFMPNPEGADSGEEWVELFASADADLSGWVLDDEGAPGAVGSSAYVFPANTQIAANQFLVIVIPEGKFALNNTGGDTLRLLWPDNHVLDSVSYTETAKQDQTYARLNSGGFAWTAIVTKGFTNQFSQALIDEEDDEESDAKTQNQAVVIDFVKISEVMPNPKGPDAGQEWVEVMNTGIEPISLHDWVLDDGDVDETIGKNSYKIQSPTIKPGEVAILTIPSGKFALNNTGIETVRLFDPNNVLVSFVVYENAKEGLSFSLLGDEWAWVLPSPEELNPIFLSSVYNDEIRINELFPEPEKGVEEFIELKNESEEEIDLADWVLSDNATSYKLPGLVIPPGGVAAIYKSESKISLNNFGLETVTLTNPLGEIIDLVEYEDAPKNQSLNLSEDDAYVWSVFVTPAEANIIKPGIVKGQALPRTGRDHVSVNDFTESFVFLSIFCYIVSRLNRNRKMNFCNLKTKQLSLFEN